MYHLHTDRIDDLPYWEYEQYIEMLNDVLKKKADAEKGGGSDASMSNPSQMANNMMRNAQNSMKIPKM